MSRVPTPVRLQRATFCHVQNNLCLGQGMMRFKCSKLSAWNAFCWEKWHDNKENGLMGNDVLQELLTDDKKAKILLKYCKHRETQATGIQISTKSKVNDVMQTLKAIENELNNLRSRTGAEAILYMARGSMDLPLRGVVFATEGVDNFMVSVMNIDNQDLISKMEGFAVQSMKGMCCKKSSKPCSDVHTAIRHKIQKGLVAITKDPNANMHWANYFRNVVQRYQVVIEGWPANIPFVNLSQASSALPDLEMIHRKWESCAICWKEIDDDHHRRTRSDKGKKRARSPDGLSCCKKIYKSTETIEMDDEDNTSPAANANIPSANISTNSTSSNTNDNTSTNTGTSTNSNVNAEASASANFTNTGEEEESEPWGKHRGIMEQ
ncbi:hypothetical protein P692DRAFT_20851330 [Suillus brevipes Sb2]|nr:hypothetical protein P692DRAFT_20851330 [Suillus brevipes Sb2]